MCTESLVKLGHVDIEINWMTDTHTQNLWPRLELTTSLRLQS